MIADTNLLEYADPALYDRENSDFEPDGPFFLALAQQLGGPVLELGCGTGRVTIPLARAGIPITGLDLTPAMLDHARQKAADLPIHWHHADVRTFDLGRQFSFIFESGATFQHLLDQSNQEAMLARVRAHLAPNGRFLLGSLFPHLPYLANEETEQEWYQYEDENGRTVRVSGTQQYDPLRQIKTETAYRRWQEADGRQIEHSAPLQLRYTFPQEMELLLRHNHLHIEQRYGDWDSSPLTPTSKFMIYLCRLTDENEQPPEVKQQHRLGGAKEAILSMRDDFDEPLSEFQEYML
jgi:SAM-dependent methyltransferase